MVQETIQSNIDLGTKTVENKKITLNNILSKEDILNSNPMIVKKVGDEVKYIPLENLGVFDKDEDGIENDIHIFTNKGTQQVTISEVASSAEEKGYTPLKGNLILNVDKGTQTVEIENDFENVEDTGKITEISHSEQDDGDKITAEVTIYNKKEVEESKSEYTLKFKKVDKENLSKILPGAAFEAKIAHNLSNFQDDSQYVKINSDREDGLFVTDEENGEFSIKIPVTSAGRDVIKLTEKIAPDGYELPEGNKAITYIGIEKAYDAEHNIYYAKRVIYIFGSNVQNAGIVEIMLTDVESEDGIAWSNYLEDAIVLTNKEAEGKPSSYNLSFVKVDAANSDIRLNDVEFKVEVNGREIYPEDIEMDEYGNIISESQYFKTVNGKFSVNIPIKAGDMQSDIITIREKATNGEYKLWSEPLVISVEKEKSPVVENGEKVYHATKATIISKPDEVVATGLIGTFATTKNNKGEYVSTLENNIETQLENIRKYSIKILKSDFEDTTQDLTANFNIAKNNEEPQTVRTPYTLAGSINPNETIIYTISEITNPEGYAKLEGEVKIQIKYTAEGLEKKIIENTLKYTNPPSGTEGRKYSEITVDGTKLYVYNEKEGTPTDYTLKIIKENEDGSEKLGGAKFAINGTTVDTLTDEITGELTVGPIEVNSIGEDKIVISEVTAPNGYMLISEENPIEITYNKVLNNYQYSISGIKLTKGNIYVKNGEVNVDTTNNIITVTIINKKAPSYELNFEKIINTNNSRINATFDYMITEKDNSSVVLANAEGKETINGLFTISNGIYTSNDELITLIEKSVENPEENDILKGKILVTIEKAPVQEGTYIYYRAARVHTEYIKGYDDSDDVGVVESDYELEWNQENRKATMPNSTYITVKDSQKNKTIKISGNVWEDVPAAGKTIGYEDSGLDGIKQENEPAIDGMTVNLYTIEGKLVETTTTGKDPNKPGYYEFNVSSEQKYYVEFVYNGYNYQHTYYIPYVNAEENPLKSHATETDEERDNFNNDLATIEKDTTVDNHIVNNNDNNLGATDLGTGNAYAMHAYVGPNGNKKGTGMYIIGNDENENYQNLNLGITRRETADLMVVKDLLNAEISINGKQYTYPYSKRELKETEEGYKYWDIQVQEEDLVYIKESDINKVNDLWLTYIIGISNQGSLNTKVNEIVDYFDKRFESVEVKILDGIDESIGTPLTPNININTSNAYNTMTINNLGLELKPNETRYLTVKFKINIQLEYEQEFSNFVELTSYSTYYAADAKSTNNGNNNTYTEYVGGDIAGRIDKDSNPGSADINNPSSFRLEDDSDTAPYAKITKNTNPRTITGVVWYDNGDGDDSRNGDGIRNEERPINDQIIKVKLVDLEGNVIKETQADSTSGAYTIIGFIPGDYYIEFEYPNGQDYKSTKFNYTEVCEEFDPEHPDDNLGKFKDSGETNYSDARDIWARRQEVNNLSNGEQQTNKSIEEYANKDISMQAITGLIDVGVEKELGYDGFSAKEHIYPNIDFGLQERPKPELELSKKVTNVQVILANDNVMIDATIDEPGSHVLWMPKNINLTLDEELMHGATLVAKYEITVTNNGETDYASKKFYYTGIPEDGEEPVTTTVGKIIDYPGAAPTDDKNASKNNLKFVDTLLENKDWEAKTIDNFKAEGTLAGYVTETLLPILENYTTILVSKDDSSFSNTALKPNDQISTTLTLSQALSTSTSSGDTRYYNNAAEVLTFKNSVGRIRMKSGSTVGNLNPDGEYDKTTTKINYEADSDLADQIVIMPPYGQKPTYYVIAAGVLAILAGGIFFIKKKVIKK